MTRSHRDLGVWRRAINLVERIYRMSASWPSDERFGLTSQIRRASVSVPANVAEGAGRRTTGEFQQFVGIAQGSLAEVETLLIIAGRLDYVGEDAASALLSELAAIRMMLTRLASALGDRRSAQQPSRPSRITDH